MNMHVGALVASPLAPPPDPMVLAVATWRHARDVLNASLEEGCRLDAHACGIIEARDLTAVFAETATTQAGFSALLSVVDFTLGEVSEERILGAIERSLRIAGRTL